MGPVQQLSRRNQLKENAASGKALVLAWPFPVGAARPPRRRPPDSTSDANGGTL